MRTKRTSPGPHLKLKKIRCCAVQGGDARGEDGGMAMLAPSRSSPRHISTSARLPSRHRRDDLRHPSFPLPTWTASRRLPLPCASDARHATGQDDWASVLQVRPLVSPAARIGVCTVIASPPPCFTRPRGSRRCPVLGPILLHV